VNVAPPTFCTINRSPRKSACCIIPLTFTKARTIESDTVIVGSVIVLKNDADLTIDSELVTVCVIVLNAALNLTVESDVVIVCVAGARIFVAMSATVSDTVVVCVAGVLILNVDLTSDSDNVTVCVIVLVTPDMMTCFDIESLIVDVCVVIARIAVFNLVVDSEDTTDCDILLTFIAVRTIDSEDGIV